MILDYRVNPKKDGSASAAFALAVTPPAPAQIIVGRGGKKGGGYGARPAAGPKGGKR